MTKKAPIFQHTVLFKRDAHPMQPVVEVEVNRGKKAWHYKSNKIVQDLVAMAANQRFGLDAIISSEGQYTFQDKCQLLQLMGIAYEGSKDRDGFLSMAWEVARVAVERDLSMEESQQLIQKYHEAKNHWYNNRDQIGKPTKLGPWNLPEFSPGKGGRFWGEFSMTLQDMEAFLALGRWEFPLNPADLGWRYCLGDGADYYDGPMKVRHARMALEEKRNGFFMPSSPELIPTDQLESYRAIVVGETQLEELEAYIFLWKHEIQART